MDCLQPVTLENLPDNVMYVPKLALDAIVETFDSMRADATIVGNIKRAHILSLSPDPMRPLAAMVPIDVNPGDCVECFARIECYVTEVTQLMWKMLLKALLVDCGKHAVARIIAGARLNYLKFQHTDRLARIPIAILAHDWWRFIKRESARVDEDDMPMNPENPIVWRDEYYIPRWVRINIDEFSENTATQIAIVLDAVPISVVRTRRKSQGSIAVVKQQVGKTARRLRRRIAAQMRET